MIKIGTKKGDNHYHFSSFKINNSDNMQHGNKFVLTM